MGENWLQLVHKPQSIYPKCDATTTGSLVLIGLFVVVWTGPLNTRNIHFLALTDDDTPPEPMVLLPDPPDEGESEAGTPPTLGNKGDSLKKKHDNDEEELNE